jgi:hypothetical protein
MAVAFVADFPGMTQEQYDSVAKEVAPGNNRATWAPGGLFHFAGPVEGGWRVVQVWESEEAFHKFAEAKLVPAFQRTGLAPMPPPQTWTIHNMITN